MSEKEEGIVWHLSQSGIQAKRNFDLFNKLLAEAIARAPSTVKFTSPDIEELEKALEEVTRENEELKGVLGLSQDEYVQQVGTWKVIQRLEGERDELLAEIAESHPSNFKRYVEDQEKIKRLAALLTEARDVLEMLDHTPECLSSDLYGECICGRDEIIEKIEQLEGGLA